MTETRQIVSVIQLVWGTLALIPAVILAYSEYRGVSGGYVHASLQPGGELYAWTRNRLLLWVVLYGVGTLFIWRTRKNDPEGARIGGFATSRTATLLVTALVAFALLLLTFATPADALLTVLFFVVGFLGIWCFTGSAKALQLAIGRLLGLASSFGVLMLVGELVFRIPSIVEKTGGSLEARSRLWNETDFREVANGNSLNLRSRYVGQPKEEGVTRILAVGDSFTAGDWVDSIDDTWPYVMEAALHRENESLQVINAGFGGANTVSEARILSEIGWLLDPDILILQYTLNDTQETEESTLTLLPLLDSGLRRKSHLYAFLNSRFQALQLALFRTGHLKDYFRDDYRGWIRSQEALERIAEAAKERSVPLLMVLYPWLSTGLDEETYPYLEIHEKLAQKAHGLGIPFLDARPLLAEVDPDGRSWWARSFDSHPNAEAHRIIGEAVASMIVDLGFIRD